MVSYSPYFDRMDLKISQLPEADSYWIFMDSYKFTVDKQVPNLELFSGKKSKLVKGQLVYLEENFDKLVENLDLQVAPSKSLRMGRCTFTFTNVNSMKKSARSFNRSNMK